MKKEDIKDAMIISASAVVGSELADYVMSEIQEQTIDVVPCVYEPHSGIIDDDDIVVIDDILEIDDIVVIDDVVDVYGPNPAIIEFESENIVSDIDDFNVIYGPASSIIDDDF